jgi:hypothetical protein
MEVSDCVDTALTLALSLDRERDLECSGIKRAKPAS